MRRKNMLRSLSLSLAALLLTTPVWAQENSAADVVENQTIVAIRISRVRLVKCALFLITGGSLIREAGLIRQVRFLASIPVVKLIQFQSRVIHIRQYGCDCFRILPNQIRCVDTAGSLGLATTPQCPWTTSTGEIPGRHGRCGSSR